MFNIQRFGDNDTVTYSTELVIGYLRSDKTVQKVTFPNPSSTLASNTVVDLATRGLSSQIFVDSKTGNPLTNITSSTDTAYKIDKTVRTLDLS